MKGIFQHANFLAGQRPAVHNADKMSAFHSVVLVFLLLNFSCAAQQYRHFKTVTPLAEGHFLILGFQGGRDSWNDPKPGVSRLAAELRSKNLPGVHIETVENRKRDLAMMLIKNSFDHNGDGHLTKIERDKVRLILYGMSFGGAAVVKLARQLHREQIPVMLTVQVDSVGRGDAVIPSNVHRAANLFQRSSHGIRGEPMIRAESTSHTQILGNYEYDYSNSAIDVSNVSWIKKIFRVAHTKMDRDPAVWLRVEQLILQELSDGGPP